MNRKSMPSLPAWRRWVPYGFALAAMSLTLGLRLASGFQAGDQPYLVLFILPIAFSAYVGGFGPGLFATAVAAAGASYFLLRPLHSLATDEVSVSDWISLIGVGVLITVFVTWLRASWVLPHTNDTKADSPTLVRRVLMFAQIAAPGAAHPPPLTSTQHLTHRMPPPELS